MTVARMRAEAEETYALRLGDIAPTVDRIQGGFSRDDGASVRKVGLLGGRDYGRPRLTVPV